MELAVVRCKGPSSAELAFGEARDRAGDEAWTHEVALLEHHHNGRIALFGTVVGHYISADEEHHASQKGAALGGIIGALLGAPLGPPGFAAGLVAGGVLGAEVGNPDETEPEPGVLVGDLRDVVPEGSSAIVLIAESSHVDAMLSALGDAGADTVRRTLSDAELAAIEQELSSSPAASPGPREEGDAPPPGAGDVTSA